MVVDDDSGDENTKFKEDYHIAEKDNCMGWG